MLSLQEMSDRLEIQDLLSAYCEAIDTHDWDALDDMFTPDALIDYSDLGGARGPLPEIKAYLDRALTTPFMGYQHLLGLPVIKVSGDSATSRVSVFNPMIVEANPQKTDSQSGTPHVFFVGLWYEDRLVRTEAGWRISERFERASYFHNVPAHFTPVDPG